MARHDAGDTFHSILELNHSTKDHRPCFIGSVSSASHGFIWITVENDKGRAIESRKYDYNGQLLEKLSLPMFTCHHIITSEGSIYFYKESSETIELVQGDKTLTIACLKDHQLPRKKMVCGMYCSGSSIIFLTMYSEIMEYGVILRFDIASRHVSRIQTDSRGNMLYLNPRCTVENQNKIMCTVDAHGIILFNRDTRQRILCSRITSPQNVATFKNQFVIQYETDYCQNVGLLSETGKLLSSFSITPCEIHAMSSDDKEYLLLVMKDGSVMERMPLKILRLNMSSQIKDMFG